MDEEVNTDYGCHCLLFVLGSLGIQFMVILQEGEGTKIGRLG